MLKKGVLVIAAAACVSYSASAENIIGNAVVIRALDKVTATTKDFTVPVGDTLHYGSLDVVVRHCEKKPPEDVPETYAFLQIFEDQNSQGKAKPKTTPTRMNSDKDTLSAKQKLFSGWMFASSPALSSLEHPVYDIWVLDCTAPAGPAEGEN